MFVGVDAVERFDRDLDCLLGRVRAGEMTLARLGDLIAVSRSVEAKMAVLVTEAARLIALGEHHGDGGASVLCDQGGKSRSEARRHLAVAETLDEMPQARSAVEAGEVSLANAERLAQAAKRTTPESVDAAAGLLDQARELSPDRFAREVDAWTQSQQDDHGHNDYLAQRQQRYLRVRKDRDKVRIDGQYDLEAGTRIGARLQRLAEALRRQDDQTARNGSGTGGENDDGGEGCRRSWDQLQADALDQLVSGDAGPGDRVGSSGGSRPNAEVIVVADIGVLTGEDLSGRCEIPGAGPVPPAVLQRIACDAEFAGVLFSDGKPLHHGATTRTATKAQRRMLIARDGGCIGCGAEPRWCQVHHIVPYAQSRRTDIDNLVLVCWKCHHNIHDHNWQITHQGGKPTLKPPDCLKPPDHPGPGRPGREGRSPPNGHSGRGGHGQPNRRPPPGPSRPPPTDRAGPHPDPPALTRPNPGRDRGTDRDQGTDRDRGANRERVPALFPT